MSKIDDEALDWVVKQAAAPLTDSDQGAFEAWYDSGERQQGAYLRAQAIWLSLDTTTMQPNLRPAVPTLTSGKRTAQPVSRRSLLIGGVAATAAAGVAAAVMLPHVNARTVLTTATGEVRKIPLADRSIASLNSDSHIEVSMTSKLRRIVLTKGEALFEVAKNPDQPFVVEAGDIHVRAVGTAFSVRRREAGADVLVTEGVVEVWSIGGAAEPRRIVAGEETYVADKADRITVSAAPQEIVRKLAWRDGQIILDNQTLAEAVEEFNRYNVIQLVIADPSLRSHRLVGQYRIDQPEDFADSVKTLLDIPVRSDSAAITLGRAVGDTQTGK